MDLFEDRRPKTEGSAAIPDVIFNQPDMPNQPIF